VLQCVAVCCSVLRCVAAEYEDTASSSAAFMAHISVLQCVAVCCRVLLCIAVCCSVLQSVAAEYEVIICCRLGTPRSVCCVCHSVLQGIEVCCRELQCVAVRCTVLESLMDVRWMRYFSTHESHHANKRVMPHCVSI